MDIAVLIPAYNPDRRLLTFVQDLRASSRFTRIIVVDDGSSDDCRALLALLAGLPDVTVLRHAVNLGKGAALKTGLNHFCCTIPDGGGVVTADADGQHLVADVLRVARQLQDAPNDLILGSRQFAATVPLRSRLGNIATKYVFWGLVGKKLEDTQSGLRGIPRELARQLLRLKNSGYEFELDMLIHCKRSGVPIQSCPIQTVYLDDNRSSHFNPIVDSLKIYAVFLRFMAASLATAAVDYLVFLMVYSMAANVLLAQSSARLAAIGINFALARQAVFHSQDRVVRSLWKFILLVVVMGATSYCLIQTAMHAFGWNVVAAKVASELLVYLANFAIQRNFIFPEAYEKGSGVLKAPDERQPVASRRAA